MEKQWKLEKYRSEAKRSSICKIRDSRIFKILFLARI